MVSVMRKVSVYGKCYEKSKFEW